MRGEGDIVIIVILQKIQMKESWAVYVTIKDRVLELLKVTMLVFRQFSFRQISPNKSDLCFLYIYSVFINFQGPCKQLHLREVN